MLTLPWFSCLEESKSRVPVKDGAKGQGKDTEESGQAELSEVESSQAGEESEDREMNGSWEREEEDKCGEEEEGRSES